MQFQRDAVCGDENAVAFEKWNHYITAIHYSAAIYTEQSVKTVASGLEVCKFPGFCVEQQPFYLKIFASCQEFCCTSALIPEGAQRLTGGCRRSQFCYLIMCLKEKRELNLQFRKAHIYKLR